MSRRIVSQTNDFIIGFPSLGLPLEKYLEQDETVNGVELFEGDRDPRYPSDSDLESIPLIVIDRKRYDSVHEDYTDEMLTPTEDNDYVIEDSLDGNFTYTVLLYNSLIASKYKEDENYLSFLGLPEYDKDTHKTDLVSVSTIPTEALEFASAREDLTVPAGVVVENQTEEDAETRSNEADDYAKQTEGQAVSEPENTEE